MSTMPDQFGEVLEMTPEFHREDVRRLDDASYPSQNIQ